MNLQKVMLAEKSQLREIKEWAFFNSNLTEVYIPASMEIIGEYAFREC